ncbi:UDP-RHAMNOSE:RHAMNOSYLTRANSFERASE 1-RELATED [Salix koriyanagi]|uniref:UDP-RHAMNOSE:RHAMNOSYLTRANSFERASE 1-RELATED n=1 Tax=Salix koriyanagi TaxID=2511006 RepID=A0A9Q0PMV7_9ROSI|nr:UDP-RHAMNOSE:RHAMNOSYLTRANSFERASE 1-RELATED [Salix koriyanagi]
MRMKPEDFTVVPEWIPFPSLVAHRPDRAAVMFHNMNSPDVSGKLTDHRFAVRSCRKFEGAYVDLLEELYQKPVFPVEYKMPVQQVHELAHGIKLFKLIFIWILRKPEGLDISELLPTGFLDRTSDRGIADREIFANQDLHDNYIEEFINYIFNHKKS